MDDLPPELDDFSEKLNQIRRPKNTQYIGDYAQPIIEKEYVPEKEPIKKQEKKSDFGLKKGFLSASNEPKKKPVQKLDEVKVDPKKQNRFEIPEVQEAMKVNDYLNKNKNEWQTPDFLEKVAKNPKVQKLFTNPEYQKAIAMMQSEPQKALQIYGKNQEFMEIFREFCKMMGQNFEDISKKEKKEDEDPVAKIIQNDPQVKEILQDQKVQAFLEYLQRNQKADFQEIMAKDPYLAPRLKILIDKKVLNLQRM